MKTIKQFSFEDFFWIEVKEHCIHWRFKDLPKEIHYTLAYNDNSPDINFHISKNIGDSEHKPAIEIFRIEKKLIEEDISSMFFNFLIRKLEYIDIDLFNSQYEEGEIGFLPFGVLEDEKLISFSGDQLKEYFKDFYEIKRKIRLKIYGNIEEGIKEYVKTSELIKIIYDNAIEFSNNTTVHLDKGLLITKDDSICVIRIFDKWYKFKKVEIQDIVNALVTPEASKKIIDKIKKALIIVKNAKTDEDTKQYKNESIRLVRSKVKQ